MVAAADQGCLKMERNSYALLQLVLETVGYWSALAAS